VFYHDSDIIFTKFPDFLYELLADDNTWYVSDTKSYIGYNYIKSKGQDVLDQMCSIVGINEQLVKEKEEESGGAQYLMKGVDWVMFEKMELDCEIMFHKITELNKKKLSEDPLHHPLQIWTADMWCLLWSAWLRGYETRIIKELDFCWATENVESYTQKYIFHNAGVTNLEKQTLFYKADYRTTHPFDVDGSSFDQTKASYKYFQFLKEVGKNSPIVYA
jgi:hypothetical protein